MGKKLKKLKFLITAGGTREYIDPVRFISNASSGQMGYALAQAAIDAGHNVVLVTAPTNLEEPKGAKIVRVETSSEMFEAVKRHFDNCDVLIMAAAVSDFAPVKVSKTKIKKSNHSLTITLKPTIDILSWAGSKKEHQFVVGFALEDKAVLDRAAKKLESKNADMIIANTPAAIGSPRSQVTILTRNYILQLPTASKAVTARKLISVCLSKFEIQNRR